MSDNLLLILGAVVVVGGLAVGYMLTRSKPNAQSNHAPDKPMDTASSATAVAVAAPPQVEQQQKLPHPEETLRQQPEAVSSPEQDVAAQEEEPKQLDEQFQNLSPQIKHRIIYRFMPHLKGMLFEDETLDGYLADAVARAMHRGWSDPDLVRAAQSGKWKKPRTPTD